MAGLFPLVAEDAGPGDLSDRDLGFAGAIGAHQADVLAREQRSLPEQDLASRCHGDEQVGGQGLVSALGNLNAELSGHCLGAGLVDVPQRDRSAEGGERPRGRAAVHARPDDRSRLGVRPAEDVRGEHGGGARAKRRHGSGVQDRLDEARIGIREDDETGHGR